MANLDKSELNFIEHFSSIGAKLSRLETSETITTQQIAAVEPLISNETDVDLADTLVRLNEVQNAYTAALNLEACSCAPPCLITYVKRY